MKLRIGEYLVERGIIVSEELELALHRQLIFGGRIGTNLINLGLITEDVLISLLQVFNNVKGINLRRVGDLKRSTIASIDRKAAIKFKCIPFEISGSNIKLASTDILKPEGKRELEHLTGKNVFPYIFPEIQWIDLMKKYYDYDPAEQEDISRREIESREESGDGVVPIQKETEFEKDELEQLLEEYTSEVNQKSGEAFGDLEEIEGYIQKDTALFRREENVSSLLDEEDSLDALISDEDFFSEYRERTSWKRPRVVDSSGGNVDSISLAEATLMLARARNREQVAIALLTKACNYADDAALFFVKPDSVNGWIGMGKNASRETVSNYKHSLLTNSFFLDMITTGRSFQGPVAISNNNRAVFRALGIPWPVQICLIPIHVKSRIVALLLLASTTDDISTQAFVNMSILAKKASITLEILIMKMKGKKDSEA
jgi:hypothetical protein